MLNRNRRRVRAAALMAVVSLVVAGCSGGAGAAAGGQVILNVAGGPTGPVQRVFNPHLPTSAYDLGSRGLIYETLAQVDTIAADEVKPWLADSWTWSDGNKKLVFKLHPGVKFTDGVGMTAQDVVFSYELLKKFPATNLRGIQFASIEATGTDAVTMTFDKPSLQFLDIIVANEILPEHIWGKVADPVAYPDADPIGTGPFTLKSFSAASYLLVKNPNYWQTGKPKIDGLQFVSKRDNEGVALALAQGQIDWGGVYVPNVGQTYTSKNPHFKAFWPTVGTDGLITNQQTAPFNDLAVRKAVSLAVDRKQIANANQGQPASNQTALPMPVYQKSVAPEYQNLVYTQDKAGAKKLLENDGYVMGQDGYYAKNGQTLSFTITDPSSYTEQIAEAQVIVSQMKDVGIKADINGVPVESINALTQKGNFQASLGYPIDTQTSEFAIYDSWMNPAYSLPIGQDIITGQNIQRWNDPATRQLFDQYPVATTDAERQKILFALQKTMVEQLPLIPLTYFPDYAEYNDTKVTGWPTAENPYASPKPGVVVAVNLVPVK
ncbi:MAG: Peptide/nickel transport system substrate-binding protein [Amycolatopsis sp.]|uniref:ABC transporter substrate-binding protein n=1 Tax=Amycolatopsis sp. TaxID=37632 RepID=UPI00262C29C4|nr:ABC transporter substrate-binding protein [Amycolatopsis sp.]MCU1679417.1 Peptide/nickel transport system substrate-binding protein [Amycolatopsis sp.]